MQSGVREITDGWSLHWGDLEYSDGWKFEEAEWEDLTSPTDIPGRTNENILWLRIKVDKGQWRDPYIFVSSIDLTTQVFESGQLSYHFGEIDQDGNSHFEGWPWHLIPVNITTSPTSLYFRIYSDYPFIGLSGEVLIGNKADLLDRVYSRGITGAVFILIIFIAGLLSTSLGLIKKDSHVALSTGLLSFDLALMMFSENELSQVVYNDPLVWRYLAVFSYFLIPAFLALILREWFQRKQPAVFNAVFWIATAFAAGVALLSAFTDFNFVNAYPYFDALFIALVLALLISSASRYRSFGIQDGLVIFGILALFVSLLLDMLSSHALIDWIGRTGQWGLIFFTLAMLAVYFNKDWEQQITLRALTSSLELQVAERTQELTESQALLQQLAREDFLTGLLNRRAFMEQANGAVANAIRYYHPLSLMLFDIDFFKEINDTHGHATGDEILRALAKVAKKECREGDLICRYGGEEFVVLLHETPASDALMLVSRLQKVIQNIVVQSPDGKSVQITASFGLISYSRFQSDAEKEQYSTPSRLLELLLNQADQAMYDVKQTGRNGIREYTLK
ncbi:hypothetical protein BGP75_03585 [Motiliproteus sp. MSK22-1]|nr:hypothetical protein BGP75_03585 [Motiliproteus sp. MSK22-1]